MSPSAISPPAKHGHTVLDGPKQLDASKLTHDLVPDLDQIPVPGLHDPGRLSQKFTTAHMVECLWTAEEGWKEPKMRPYGKLALEPTASVLHYATESFEGMKVYRGYDNKVRLFRPWLNCERFRKSNARVCLPDFDPSQMLSLISKYLAIECRRWLPEPGSNIYVRPAMIGSGSALGIQKPPEALFFLFAALFPQSSGLPTPGIKLLASDPEFIRAWPGGFGAAKVGANYGPAMVAQAKARENNCSQTLWLYGEDNIVTEAGASNFFVVWKRKDSQVVELVTSSLSSNIILDGITRRSILELSRERLAVGSSPLTSPLVPLEVVERQFGMHEIVEAHADGRLLEAFVSGTAMFVAPVSAIQYNGALISFPMTVTSEGHKTPDNKYSSQLKSWLEDIIYGNVEHEWAHVVSDE